MAVVVE